MLDEARAESSSVKIKATGEAESITMIAKARKLEADELQTTKIASELAKIRAAGDAGEKIFSG